MNRVENLKALRTLVENQITNNLDLTCGDDAIMVAKHDFMCDIFTAIMLATGELYDSDIDAEGVFRDDDMHDFIFEYADVALNWLKDAKTKIAEQKAKCLEAIKNAKAN